MQEGLATSVKSRVARKGRAHQGLVTLHMGRRACSMGKGELTRQESKQQRGNTKGGHSVSGKAWWTMQGAQAGEARGAHVAGHAKTCSTGGIQAHHGCAHQMQKWRVKSNMREASSKKCSLCIGWVHSLHPAGDGLPQPAGAHAHPTGGGCSSRGAQRRRLS